ncbi:methyl-accepting chemotaxis protein [Oikeobacillus pervagus]|uniref:Methyl-accepting chemotaxis protein n=1 Tax=Oikeobacillus pervagus TaxID=1325931 RepID=A0AAJ1WH98_9BACI|nr:methyl-accepting chemotaxis protein [Oikeobacillus pervagus]MDQ0215987.1 methyl-accepting chemotaxis protein [Oikeobacillus pervagus]
MRKFYDLKIVKKLTLLVLILLMAMGIVWFLGDRNVNRANESLNEMYNENLIPIGDVITVQSNLHTIEGGVFELILQTDPEKKEEILSTRIKKMSEENNQLLKELSTTHLDREEKQIYDRFMENLQRFREERNRVIELALKNKQEEAYTAYEKIKPRMEILASDIQKFSDLNEQYAIDAERQAQKRAIVSNRVMMISLGIALLFSAILSYFIITSITKPLKELNSLTLKVSEGDLTEISNIHTKDEVGQLAGAINQMITDLRRIMGNISGTTQELTAASEELSASADQSSTATTQIATAIQEVANGMENQMVSTSETAKATEENSKGIQRMAEAAHAVVQASNETVKQAEKGNEVIQQAVHQMGTIDTTVQQSIKTIQLLEQSSKEINNIVTMILNIADQTNLLALNASIEAARAGEHGKGFAVVAEEIRKLAEQTSQSSNKVSQLVQGIQTSSATSVEAMNQINVEVTKGLKAVKLSGDYFQQIVEATEKGEAQIQEISATTEQMFASSEEVSASVDSIEEISRQTNDHTQSIAASSEEQLATMQEISAAAESLTKMAEELQKVTSIFKV